MILPFIENEVQEGRCRHIMKIVEARDAFFSDYEVLQFLSKLERQHHWDDESSFQDQHQKKKLKTNRPYNHPELQAITRDVIAYLSINKGPNPQDNQDNEEEELVDKNQNKSSISKINDEQFTEMVRKLNQFELFKAEKLQIVNQLPSSMVHLYSVVEECDSRFTEEQIDQILSIVRDYV